jgi:uncharacterized membrane protein YbhN (UPF0104 family)
MIRIFSGVFLSLVSFLAYAAVAEDAATPAELPPPDATGLVAFLLAMVVMVVGFVWHIRRSERKRREREASSRQS